MDQPEEPRRTWTVRFFQTARGEYPVQTFIKEQDETTYAKILHSIRLLSLYGPFLKPPYIKKIEHRLYELRISGTVAVRIFYTVHNGEYYLLHAFKKKSQKTPGRELKTAIDRMKEIL